MKIFSFLVIAATPDPQALFVFSGSRYNEAGYQVAAEAIIKGLEKGGAGP